jgi:hypothetical protein
MSIADKLRPAFAWAGTALPDALMVAGAGSVSAGAGMVYQPAGWMVAGVFALVAGVMLARAE